MLYLPPNNSRSDFKTKIMITIQLWYNSSINKLILYIVYTLPYILSYFVYIFARAAKIFANKCTAEPQNVCIFPELILNKKIEWMIQWLPHKWFCSVLFNETLKRIIQKT